MSIAIGSNSVSKVYLGYTEVDKIYLGSTMIYSATLPYDAEVEYLYSDGNPYFVIPFTPSEATDSIEFDFRRTTSDNQQRLCYAQGETYAFHVYVNGNGRLAYSRAGSAAQLIGSDVALLGLVRHKATVDYYSKKCTLDFCTKNISTTTRAAAGNLVLFGQYNANAAFQGNIYGVRIWRSGSLVYDLIPVRKDGVGYLYDKKGGSLYGNQGTGTFTLGYDKKTSLSDYTQVDYIRNNDFVATAPYIDTGIPNNPGEGTIDMQMTIKWNSVASNKTQGFGNTYLIAWGCTNGVWSNAYTLEDESLDGVTPSTSDYVTVKSKQFTGTPTEEAPLALFRRYQGGKRSNPDATYVCCCDLARYKIWKDGTLVRDFVPVLHPSNVYGMFDLVGNKFYDSANSGTFTGGFNS